MKITHKAQIDLRTISPTNSVGFWFHPSSMCVTSIKSEDDEVLIEWTPFEIQVEASNQLGISPLQVESMKVYSNNSKYTDHADNDTEVLYVHYKSASPSVYELFICWILQLLFNINRAAVDIVVSHKKAPVQRQPRPKNKKEKNTLSDRIDDANLKLDEEIVLDFEHVVNHQFAD